MTDIHKRNRIFQITYCIILFLYPLLRVNQGLSVMDTTYSLSNFAYFHRMEGTWMVATYLSNVVGHALMKLPFGGTMLGINIYTSLIASLTAVSVFVFLKRDIYIHVLFIGEFIALSLCWCPTTILYNYLTYLMFTLAALILYRGLCGGRDDCYVIAGILLGLNVGTRFPNVTEAALILAVWYVGFINRKRIRRVIHETGLCIVGFVIGFGIILATVVIRYDGHAYGDMINTLFAMTDKAQDYKPLSMVTAIFGDYIYAWKWMAMFAAGMVISGIIYAVCERICIARLKGTDKDSFEKNARFCRIMHVIKILASMLVMLFIVRICYGQGMFSFRYYEYGSMYYWAVCFIAIITVMCVIYLVKPETERNPVAGEALKLHHKKILAAITLIVAYITCLGSNNAMYPIVNNMFIAAPFGVWILYELIKDNVRHHLPEEKKDLVRPFKFGAAVLIFTVAAAVLIQGTGFHSGFALQDGDDGNARTATVSGHVTVSGIKTTEQNAENLQGLMDYVSEYCTHDKKVLLYGNVPGLGYLLHKKSALSTFWPDLASFTEEEWDRDLDSIEDSMKDGEDAPLIITSIQVAAWESGDSGVCEYWGVDQDKFRSDEKLSELMEFMKGYGYTQVYCNNGFSVYRVEN